MPSTINLECGMFKNQAGGFKACVRFESIFIIFLVKFDPIFQRSWLRLDSPHCPHNYNIPRSLFFRDQLTIAPARLSEAKIRWWFVQNVAEIYTVLRFPFCRNSCIVGD